MNSDLVLPEDVQLIWDPRPDEGEYKRGDSFCFLQTCPDGTQKFWKEYPYDFRIIQRYHQLQNQIAKNTKGLRVDISKRIRVLLLPDIGQAEVVSTFISPYRGCRVEIPYVSGEFPRDIFSISQSIRSQVPGMKIQLIQPVNCREAEGEIVVTDIAWDIPTFLLQNPSSDPSLNRLVNDTYMEWSHYMRENFRFLD